MASIETPEPTAPPPPPSTEAKEIRPPEHVKAAPPPKVPEYKARGGEAAATNNYVVVDVALRVLLLATALVAVVVIATSKQTKRIPVAPRVSIPVTSKFTNSPAFVYFEAAMSVALAYSIITTILSVLALMKPGGSSTKMQFHFVILDALLLGIVASATGTAGGVAYIGLKGNSHTRWNKICNVYDTFCRHLGASIVMSLISSFALLLLVWLSVYTLSKKIHR